MSNEPNSPQDRPDPDDRPASLRARVPDHVAGGCFSTGVIVMTGPNEFIIDFLQTIGRPHRVAARIVLPHAVMPQFIEALDKNLSIYRERFGEPPAPPKNPPNPNERRPSPQEIYDDLKMPDEVLSGAYANGVMIGHGVSEFGLDFLTSFFPQSAVSSRVFLAAGQVPRLLESLVGSMRQLQQQRGQLPGPQPPGPQPPSAQPPSAQPQQPPPEPRASDPPSPGAEPLA
ncbi:MAG: DUF3467 domain-containing protein [Planctomycetaceae bacterium]